MEKGEGIRKMRDWNTFFQTCIYLCIVIIIFCVAIVFVNTLNIYTDVDSGPVIANEADNVFTALSGFSGGMEYIWIALVTAGGLGALAVAKLTQSTNMIGIWLFSSMFWTAYHNCITVIDVNEWIPGNFLLMFTVAFLFLWGAAVTGMLTGSG